MYPLVQRGRTSRGYRENVRCYKELWKIAKPVVINNLEYLRVEDWPFSPVPRIVEVAVVLIVGAMLAVISVPDAAYGFVPVLLLMIRPVCVWVSIAGSTTTLQQRVLMAWFGIRGIGSVYYLTYAINHGLDAGLAEPFIAITLTVVATSIVIHGISVTPLMQRYARRKPRPAAPCFRPNPSGPLRASHDRTGRPGGRRIRGCVTITLQGPSVARPQRHGRHIGSIMKEALGALLVGLVLGVSVPWLRTAFEAQPSEKDQPRKPVERRTNGQGFVKLDHPRQVSAGIVSANPQPMQLAAEVEAYGRVLDPTPLTTLVLEIDSAQATLDASAKEYARATTLFADNQNASARALESATAAMKRDRALRDAARARLLAGWGKSVAERDDLPALLKALTALESALVRLDLPPDQPLSSAPIRARLVFLSDENRSAQADFLGPAPSTDGQTQGTGLLFLLRKNALEITPGGAVTGFIEVRGDPLRGVEVPGSAVVRHERRAWVYVQTGKARFTRRPIPLKHASGDGWFVSEGVGPSDRIVVSGAQALLSEELKSQIGFPE